MSTLSRRGFGGLLAAALFTGALTTAVPAFAQIPGAPAVSASQYTIGTPERFTVHVPQDRLDAIRARVAAAPRLAPLIDGDGRPAGWRYGADPQVINPLLDFWADGYDWRRAEARLNRFQNYRVEIGGKNLHYIIERGSGRNPMPLLLIHGWTYSALSYVDVIDRLAHPERHGGNARDAYTVVVVSVPGIGFSEAPDRVEGLAQLGERYHALMTRVLGFDRYVASGGDQGALSATFMSVNHPAAVAGLNVHMLFPRQPEALFGSGTIGAADATPAERAFAAAEQTMSQTQMDYFRLHVSRGETLSAAMMDSPAGALAWIVEKYWFWSDQRTRRFDQIFTRDQLIDEVMMYVATDSFRTSMWPYMALQFEAPVLQPDQRITVPYGVQQWEDPIHPRRPREFVERSATNIVQFTNMPRGGHFPFYEEPELYANDLLAFRRELRGR